MAWPAVAMAPLALIKSFQKLNSVSYILKNVLHILLDGPLYIYEIVYWPSQIYNSGSATACM